MIQNTSEITNEQTRNQINLRNAVDYYLGETSLKSLQDCLRPFYGETGE